MKYHRVTVEIQDQVAQVEVDQAFVNDSEVPLEATYVFPLPEDAAISDFSLYVDGERLEGRILDKEEAREIYESIVRRNRDPALLEYVGRNAFQAQVFPIPPHGERRVQISYTQLLSQEAGLVHFLYPLNTEKFSPTAAGRGQHQRRRALADADQGRVLAQPRGGHRPPRARPTSPPATKRTMSRPAPTSSCSTRCRPRTSAPSLTTYRQGDEDGFFLLLVAPKADFRQQEVVAKDVMLVLDISGSMEGEKLEQAKEALRFVLERLNPDDRFNILTFNDTIDTYAETLRSAERADEAEDFVDDLRGRQRHQHQRGAAGGAAPAARRAPGAGDLPHRRPAHRGHPGPGRHHRQRERRRLAPARRLFVFGVGDDVNTVLLDTLAEENRGASQYVRPDEDVAAAVSSFYEKVSTPVLADIELDFGDIEVSDVYPQPLPDLFAGTPTGGGGPLRRARGRSPCA